MPGFVILPSAARDLDEQADYLVRSASIDTALRFYEAAEATFSFLVRHPGIGVVRESRDRALVGLRVARVDGFEKHLIFYRTGINGIEIVRVLHGHRDIAAILGPEP